jgi:tetratricopeptide (TPR) repeat protein
MKAEKKLRVCLLGMVILLGVVCLQPPAQGAISVSERHEKAIKQLKKAGFKGIDKALKTFNQLIKEAPDFLAAYVSAADAYLLKYEFSKPKNRKWLKKALGYLNTCIKKKKNFDAAYFKKAIIYFNLNRLGDAEDSIKKALEINPKNLDARILYLQYLLSAKKVKKASQFAASSIKNFPNDPAPLKFFADIFSRAHVYKDAILYYNKVLGLVAHAPYTRLALGKVYQNQNKLDSAIKNYKKAIKLEPKLYEAHFNLGYCYSRKGKIKAAIKHLEIYSGKFPGDVSVLNNLALLYERAGQTQKARLMWLKTKEKAKEKVYKERAEAHLYNLIHKTQKNADNNKTSRPSKGGKINEGEK